MWIVALGNVLLRTKRSVLMRPDLVDIRSPTPYIKGHTTLRATPPLEGAHGSPALRDTCR